jgi:hypothetical protein
MTGEILLVGSVPLDTVEEMFRASAVRDGVSGNTRDAINSYFVFRQLSGTTSAAQIS